MPQVARGRPTLATPKFILHPLKSGIWEVRWTEGRHTRTKSTGTKDRTQAEAFLRRHVAEWHAPKLPPDPSLSALIAQYRKDHVPHVASPRTAMEALEKIEAKLGAYRPKELTDTVLRSYAAWRLAQPRWGREDAGNVSNGTVAREVNALRGVRLPTGRQPMIQGIGEFTFARGLHSRHHPQPVRL